MLPIKAWHNKPTSDMLTSLDIEPLSVIITKHIISFISKIMVSGQPYPLYSCLFCYNQRTHNYFIPRINYQKNKKISFSYIAPYLWSLIDTETKANHEQSKQIVLSNLEALTIFGRYVNS